ncbi:hypothetical protein O3Q52_41695 [Streptomyces sp. ActVer]|uniref:hypothetical protein n=1 Tax=Streptomyces sp. ActVer TaxID=3014558 RepID=UPI0022B3AD25|nr:hypothetical protein [Streptomyces sp. ActVer]MCZ4514538.1 hypothetical protein [Streptomyces sp. ActVer]
MFPVYRYFAWTQGQASATVTMGLDASRRYLITGGLTGKSGSSYGQIFISVVCTQRSSDQIQCGIRDDPASPPDVNIKSLGAVEFLQNATRVTVKLRGDGELHRAEGVVYDIT